MYTIINTKSIIDDRGVPVRKDLIWSNSLTLATVSPARLFSKYFNGSENKCLNNLALNVTSILLVVCTNK